MAGQASSISDLVPRGIREARKRRGYSQQAVIDRLAELFAPEPSPLTRVKLAKIETGARKAAVDDVMHIAAALDIPPVLLLIPPSSHDDVAVTPNSVVDPFLALRWVQGIHPLTSSGRGTVNTEEAVRMARPLRLLDRVDVASGEASRIKAKLDAAEALGQPESVLVELRTSYGDALDDLVDALMGLKDAGYHGPEPLPRLREDVQEFMRMAMEDQR